MPPPSIMWICPSLFSNNTVLLEMVERPPKVCRVSFAPPPPSKNLEIMPCRPSLLISHLKIKCRAFELHERRRRISICRNSERCAKLCFFPSHQRMFYTDNNGQYAYHGLCQPAALGEIFPQVKKQSDYGASASDTKSPF